MSGTDDLRIVVFEPNPDVQTAKLDGKVLQFPNNFRPAKRYLYFAFVASLLRRQRHEVPGWWRNRFDSILQEVWATPGECLRRSTVLTLAHRIGHMLPEEASAFVGVKYRLAGATTNDHPDPTFEDKRDQLVSDSLQLSPGIVCRDNDRDNADADLADSGEEDPFMELTNKFARSGAGSDREVEDEDDGRDDDGEDDDEVEDEDE